jgi:SAM-dependent methyltransferase
VPRGPRSGLDFGSGAWRRHLDDTRRFVWDDWAWRELFAGPQGLDLRPGLQVADLGCGWGFLGLRVAPAVRPGGAVLGFDLSEELVAEGRRRAKEAGLSREIRFEINDITRLDAIPDRRFDRAMCQSVLMHLSQPEDALREARRVLKPGGRMVAVEADVLAAVASRREGVAASPAEAAPGAAGDDARERLHLAVLSQVCDGARRTGAGDWRIGARLPSLFAAAGLRVVSHWINPRLHVLQPPYDEAARGLAEILLREESPESREGRLGTWQPLFLAGGGSPALWDEWQAAEDARRSSFLRALRDGTLALTWSSAFHVCVGLVGEGAG